MPTDQPGTLCTQGPGQTLGAVGGRWSWKPGYHLVHFPWLPAVLERPLVPWQSKQNPSRWNVTQQLMNWLRTEEAEKGAVWGGAGGLSWALERQAEQARPGGGEGIQAGGREEGVERRTEARVRQEVAELDCGERGWGGRRGQILDFMSWLGTRTLLSLVCKMESPSCFMGLLGGYIRISSSDLCVTCSVRHQCAESSGHTWGALQPGTHGPLPGGAVKSRASGEPLLALPRRRGCGADQRLERPEMPSAPATIPGPCLF